MNQQQLENENQSYIEYHLAIEHAKYEYFPDIVSQLPPKPKYDFSQGTFPPTGQCESLLEYTNGEEMPVGIDLRDSEFFIMYGKTCNFTERMIITRIVGTGKFFYKTQDDYKIKHWYNF